MSDPERVQYKFLIPSDLKARLEYFAQGSRRSLSAEIVARLDESTLQQVAPIESQTAERVGYLRGVATFMPEKEADILNAAAEIVRLYQTPDDRLSPEQQVKARALREAIVENVKRAGGVENYRRNSGIPKINYDAPDD